MNDDETISPDSTTDSEEEKMIKLWNTLSPY